MFFLPSIVLLQKLLDSLNNSLMKILSLAEYMLVKLVTLSQSERFSLFKVDVSKKCFTLLTLNAQCLGAITSCNDCGFKANVSSQWYVLFFNELVKVFPAFYCLVFEDLHGKMELFYGMRLRHFLDLVGVRKSHKQIEVFCLQNHIKQKKCFAELFVFQMFSAFSPEQNINNRNSKQVLKQASLILSVIVFRFVTKYLFYVLNFESQVKLVYKFETFLNQMSLEATLIMLDNSAFAINGDYEPTRWESQVDSASLLIQAKLQANQQSSVGIGLMGGKQVQILCTPTSDSTKANSFLFGIKCNGELHFSQAIQIGALSLKHRSNDTQKQRMICFVGSTISEDVQTLKILAKKLKKNAVSVDLICFGDCSEEQLNKVQTFVNTIQNQDNSHLVIAKPGENISDKLIGSSIFGGVVPNIGGGVDEVDDPELAAAIRMSLQESQQPRAPVEAPQPPQQQSVIPAPQPSRQGQAQVSNPHQPTQQQLEQLAIQMSLQQFNLKQQQNKESQKKEEKQGQKKEKKE